MKKFMTKLEEEKIDESKLSWLERRRLKKQRKALEKKRRAAEKEGVMHDLVMDGVSEIWFWGLGVPLEKWV